MLEPGTLYYTGLYDRMNWSARDRAVPPAPPSRACLSPAPVPPPPAPAPRPHGFFLFFFHSYGTYIGASISIFGNLCISAALNLQKFAHNSIAEGATKDRGEPGEVSISNQRVQTGDF